MTHNNFIACYSILGSVSYLFRLISGQICVNSFNNFRVSDNFAFAEVHDQFGSRFRLHYQFAVFVFSQLQIILHYSYLGDISKWEKYLTIDLNQPDLPYKTANEFVLNSDFHRLVTTSKLPRPSKFVEQTISFCKLFCSILLSHEIIKSDLIRGLACFDSAVIPHGSEGQYLTAVEILTTHFVSLGWMSPSDKTRAISQNPLLLSFAYQMLVNGKIGSNFWCLITSYSVGPNYISCLNFPVCACLL